MRSKIAAVFMSLAAALGFGLVVAPVSNAAIYFTSASLLHPVCQFNYGAVGWRAELSYPSQGGYGWRCYKLGDSPKVLKGMNIEAYCQQFGWHARGGSTAYNWRCDV